MGNCWLHTNKIVSVSGVVITPDSAATLYPKTNLYNNNPASVFRTTDAAGAHNIVFDFGTATSIDTLAIANPNFRSSATITIQANAANAWGAPSFTEVVNCSGLANDPAFENLFHKFSSTQNFRYYRLLMSDIGNPDGYYEIGETWLGSRVTPSQDWEVTWTQNYSDVNVLHQTEWLHDYAYIRDTGDARSISVEWTGITAATVTQIRQLKRSIKTSGYPFWVCPVHTNNPPEALFVRMLGDLEISQRSPTIYGARAQFRELPRGQTLPT